MSHDIAAQSGGLSLYQRISDGLAQRIASGEYKPGDRLPTEAELGKRLDVSRITIRQALELLKIRGLVEGFAGRGTFVKAPRDQGVWELRSISDLIQLSVDMETHVKSWGRLAPPAMVAEFFGSDEIVYQLRAVRTRRGSKAPVYFAENFLSRPLGERVRRSQLASHTMINLIQNHLGVKVEKATEEIGAGAADAMLAVYLSMREGEPVLIQRISLFDSSGEPIGIGTTWWRSDRFIRRYAIAPGN